MANDELEYSPENFNKISARLLVSEQRNKSLLLFCFTFLVLIIYLIGVILIFNGRCL